MTKCNDLMTIGNSIPSRIALVWPFDIQLFPIVVPVVPSWFMLLRISLGVLGVLGVLGGSNRIHGAGEIVDQPADHFVSQRCRDAKAGLARLFFEAAQSNRTAAT